MEQAEHINRLLSRSVAETNRPNSIFFLPMAFPLVRCMIRIPVSADGRTGDKAISAKKPTSLLVFSSVFGVVATVTWFDYAPIATPCRQTRILRNLVCPFPPIA
jgi:hypothetical protein